MTSHYLPVRVVSETDAVSTEPADADQPVRPQSVDELSARLGEQAYLADRGLATAVFLSLSLGQPLLLEGEAGVGKTEVAKALAPALGADLVRLQCYEGIDAIRRCTSGITPDNSSTPACSKRDESSARTPPTRSSGPGSSSSVRCCKRCAPRDRAVLLIDEIDRADDEFEAFLLEMLSDFQVTVPELGTIRAERPPAVVLTSNRTRELHDALKRRCLYHWIDYPSLRPRGGDRRGTRATVPADPRPARGGGRRPHPHARSREAARRRRDHRVGQGVVFLGVSQLERDSVDVTLGAVVKDHDDLVRIREDLERILADD